MRIDLWKLKEADCMKKNIKFNLLYIAPNFNRWTCRRRKRKHISNSGNCNSNNGRLEIGKHWFSTLTPRWKIRSWRRFRSSGRKKYCSIILHLFLVTNLVSKKWGPTKFFPLWRSMKQMILLFVGPCIRSVDVYYPRVQNIDRSLLMIKKDKPST